MFLDWVNLYTTTTKAVASDQRNYAKNINMIKGVHQLTLCPNMLISLIDHFTIFNGWVDSARNKYFCHGGGGGGRVLMARIHDPHMGPTHTHTHTRVGAHTCTDRHMNVYAQADG